MIQKYLIILKIKFDYRERNPIIFESTVVEKPVRKVLPEGT